MRAARRAPGLIAAPLALAAAAALATTGCEGPEAIGFRNEPIPIALEQGVPLVRLTFGDSSEPQLASVDTLSPLTVLRDAADGAERTADLRLLEQPVCQGAGCDEVTRFIFKEQSTWDLPVERVGNDAGVAVRGVLGFSVLRRFTVQLRYAASSATLTLRDELPDTNDDLAADCDPHTLLDGKAAPGCKAVLSAGLLGGGVFAIGGREMEYDASRVVMPICLAPETFDPVTAKPAGVAVSGQAAAAVVATGLGISVIARSAFERLRTRIPTLSEGKKTTLHLPSGPIEATLTTIPALALVADRTTDLGPCGELARRRRLLLGRRDGVLDKDSERDGAASALLAGGIPMAIVEDGTELLSGLRNELRPAAPDVDVLLGGSVLERFDLDIDYPQSRTVLTCAEAFAQSCRVLPSCDHTSSGDAPTCS